MLNIKFTFCLGSFNSYRMILPHPFLKRSLISTMFPNIWTTDPLLWISSNISFTFSKHNSQDRMKPKRTEWRILVVVLPVYTRVEPSHPLNLDNLLLLKLCLLLARILGDYILTYIGSLKGCTN